MITMPVAGRKPKPDGMAVNRHQPTHDWAEVPDVPFECAPKLPGRVGRAWPTATKRWWKAVSCMPHCSLWSESDWQFAFDTAVIAAEFHEGNWRASTELRNREKVIGTTVDYRRDLRIRYTRPVPAVSEDDDASVTSLDAYRDL